MAGSQNRRILEDQVPGGLPLCGMIMRMDDDSDTEAGPPKLLTDTAPWAERVQFDFFRQAPDGPMSRWGHPCFAGII